MRPSAHASARTPVGNEATVRRAPVEDRRPPRGRGRRARLPRRAGAAPGSTMAGDAPDRSRRDLASPRSPTRPPWRRNVQRGRLADRPLIDDRGPFRASRGRSAARPSASIGRAAPSSMSWTLDSSHTSQPLDTCTAVTASLSGAPPARSSNDAPAARGDRHEDDGLGPVLPPEVHERGPFVAGVVELPRRGNPPLAEARHRRGRVRVGEERRRGRGPGRARRSRWRPRRAPATESPAPVEPRGPSRGPSAAGRRHHQQHDGASRDEQR